MGSNTDFIRSEMGSENYKLSFKEYITERVDRMLENFGSLFGNHPTGDPKTSPSNGSSLEKLVESVVSRKSDSPEARGYITPVTKDESNMIDSKDPYRYRKKLLGKCYPKVRKKDIDSLDMLSLDASVESSVEILGMNEKSENGKKDFRGCLENSISRMDVISSVLLVTVKNILYPITEDVLRQVFLPYGFMEKLVIIQQFANVQALVHYKTNQCAVAAKAALQGRCIYDGCCELDIQLSILENSVRRIDEPSCNLLVTVDNMLYPITVDVLRQVFSPYGSVEEIIIVQKSVGYQALVQYQALQCAATARTALNGRNIYDGCCKLDIQFSNLGANSDFEVHEERINSCNQHVLSTFEDEGDLMEQETSTQVAKDWKHENLNGTYHDWRKQSPNHGGGNEKSVESGFQGTTYGRDRDKHVPSPSERSAAALGSSYGSLENGVECFKEFKWLILQETENDAVKQTREPTPKIVNSEKSVFCGDLYVRYVWDPGEVEVFREPRKINNIIGGQVKIRIAGTQVFSVCDSEADSGIVEWSDFELEIDKNILSYEKGRFKLKSSESMVVKNKHKKVQEESIDLVGMIADRGAEIVTEKEWRRNCLAMLQMPKALKEVGRPAFINTLGVPELVQNRDGDDAKEPEGCQLIIKYLKNVSRILASVLSYERLHSPRPPDSVGNVIDLKYSPSHLLTKSGVTWAITAGKSSYFTSLDIVIKVRVRSGIEWEEDNGVVGLAAQEKKDGSIREFHLEDKSLYLVNTLAAENIIEKINNKNISSSSFFLLLSSSLLLPLICSSDSHPFLLLRIPFLATEIRFLSDSLEFDRYDFRYLKVKDSAEKFAVVQFGVCPFRWDSRTQSFVSYPHNFFIFPRQELTCDPPAHEFLCQTTSMDFLAKYQFDFNTCIHEGISYLSRRQEEEASKRLEMLYNEEGVETEDLKLVRLADVLFAHRMKKRLNEWRSELLNCGNASSESTETVFYHMRPALSLKGFTSHQLRVIKLVLGKHFGDLAYIHANDKSSCPQDFVMYTDSESDKENLMKEAKDERKRVAESKIQSAIGFRQVIDLLSSEKKLIVGHNSFLDIAHVYSKFVGPLPSTAENFVASITDHFPYIIDTKILLNVNPMLHQRMKKSSTSLSSAFSSLCPQIEIPSLSSDSFLQQRVKIDVEVDNVRCSNWNAGGKHEAGYDAFMTGCIFAQACSHLSFDFKDHSQSENFAQSEKFEKYINRLYLSWTRGDIIDLRAGHSNAENWRASKSKYEKIVLIWNFPRKLKAREIKECICKAFGSTSVTSVYHLDDTAVFVLFKNSELVSDFLNLKQQLESDNGPVTILHPLSKILEGGKTGAADYEAYKEICSSHISKVLFSDQAETVGVKSRTRPDPKGETIPEGERRENMVAVTDKASELIDAFLANSEVEAARIN